jgi:hypothetical protein
LKFVAALVAALMTGGTFGFMAAAILTNSKRCDIQSGEVLTAYENPTKSKEIG